MLIIKNKRNRWVRSINKQKNRYGSYFWSELKSDTKCFVIMTALVLRQVLFEFVNENLVQNTILTTTADGEAISVSC